MLIPGSVGLSSRGRRLERLAAEDLVSAHSLLQTFEDGLAKYLNDTWAKLISDLEGRKLHDEFQAVSQPSGLHGGVAVFKPHQYRLRVRYCRSTVGGIRHLPLDFGARKGKDSTLIHVCFCNASVIRFHVSSRISGSTRLSPVTVMKLVSPTQWGVSVDTAPSTA